jgi:hypothetical protein
MNATRPEWIDLVRKAADTYSVADLPSLADEFGHGRWKLNGNPTVRADGTSLWVLYWEVGTTRVGRRSVRVGDFDGKPRHLKPRRKDLPPFQTELTIGWDEHGRRVMREKAGQTALVIEIDDRGLPKPIPIEKAGSVRITPNYHHA